MLRPGSLKTQTQSKHHQCTVTAQSCLILKKKVDNVDTFITFHLNMLPPRGLCFTILIQLIPKMLKRAEGAKEQLIRFW